MISSSTPSSKAPTALSFSVLMGLVDIVTSFLNVPGATVRLNPFVFGSPMVVASDALALTDNPVNPAAASTGTSTSFFFSPVTLTYIR